MNPPSFTGQSTSEDLENFVEGLNKVFNVMHVIESERVDLAAYQLKNVARTWLDQWKESRDKDAPHLSWYCFEEVFLGRFFPENLKRLGYKSSLL